MSETVDDAVPVSDKIDSYSFIDYLEADPAKRLMQVQQVRAHLLRNSGYIDKEAAKLLRDMSQTDLGILRLEVDKDNSQSYSEMAKAVSELFRSADDPHRVSGKVLDAIKAPSLALGDLGEKPVEDWALSQELGSPEYSEIIKEG